MQEASEKAILYALLANIGIALSKSWGAWFTGSGSMLAEAIHSYADAGNQVLLFIGLVQARKPPDVEHPLGYGKISYFWAFIVAIMLFSLGGLFSIYEGVHKLQEPEPLEQIWAALLILAIAIVLEGASLLGALREIRKLRGRQSFREWFAVTRNAELVVVLGEDVAAEIGLTLAFIFVALAGITGDTRYDAFGSICIGVVLIVVSVFVATRIKSLLVGRSAEPALRKLIDKVIVEDPAIERLLHTITLQVGPKIMVAIKIRMDSTLSIDEAVAHINALEKRLKQQVPAIGWCFVEPDIVD
ncbi:MAG TPA: cation diffusion facilitator family transporter [Gammaproteobacteria bacterium]|jgi:cation diffusion facilitator family transporter|nr:cation diffusion facilitator family transporter [Gammaproteobacteria bacterium]MDP7154131.1 cation diffusion facilitator family transporter [Gammaproteobacteria bacterium]MDP7659584.1 cation diffusion facilitator family transporter [Gammaproteobacteria bacterium]HJP37650.1 cation diffusion facilitator family transporter [Gammaproteobacteria bacterium]